MLYYNAEQAETTSTGVLDRPTDPPTVPPTDSPLTNPPTDSPTHFFTDSPTAPPMDRPTSDHADVQSNPTGKIPDGQAFLMIVYAEHNYILRASKSN